MHLAIQLKWPSTLNSNLILLIRSLQPRCCLYQRSLNSNLILLIRAGRFGQWRGCWPPLNSNLILLIHSLLFTLNSVPATLNSNLILLIPTVFPATVVLFTYFKFQSDSINTVDTTKHHRRIFCFKFQSDSINTKINRPWMVWLFALNSNLILLILYLLPTWRRVYSL